MAMRDGGPFAALGFVDGGDGGVGVGLGGELVEGGEDEVDAVFVDDVDEGWRSRPVGSYWA